MEDEFAKLTAELETAHAGFKEGTKKLLAAHHKFAKYYAVGTKREREEEKEEEKEETADFNCEGRFWEEDPVPCQKGKRAHVVAPKITYTDGHKHTVCKDCRSKWDGLKRAEKKAKKEAE